jgi:integrase
MIGNKRLCEITNTDLDGYQNARLSQGISAHSVNKECILWGMILRRARLWHRLAEDFRPLRTRPSDIGRAASREELRNLALIAQRKRIWEAAFYGSVLAANCGLRGGEIKRLKIGALDLVHRRLTVHRDSANLGRGSRDRTQS